MDPLTIEGMGESATGGAIPRRAGGEHRGMLLDMALDDIWLSEDFTYGYFGENDCGMQRLAIQDF